jgi:hypothetical protein
MDVLGSYLVGDVMWSSGRQGDKAASKDMESYEFHCFS